MSTTLEKDAILQENKLLIDLAVLSACNRNISTELENYLTLSTLEGWQQLVGAVRLIVSGKRHRDNFTHLDDEDTIVIDKILELLSSEEVVVQNLLVSAQGQISHSPDNALKLVESALKMQPHNHLAHAIQGQIYHSQNNLIEAAASYQKSIELHSAQPRVLLNLGVVLSDSKQYEQAINVFECIFQYQQDDIDAIAHLAYLYERSYELGKTQRLVTQGLSIDVNNPTLNFIQAKLLQRENRLKEAIEYYLKSIDLGLTEGLTAEAYSRLGYLYDQTNKIDQSIECFIRSNSIYTEQCQKRRINKQEFLNDVQYVRNIADRITFERSAMPGSAHRYQAPVFLVGFPRSGTTLLNQVLDSHGDIQTLEEKPSATNLVNKLHQMVGNNGHAVLQESEINQLKEAYFNTVNQYIQLDPNRVFIDKFPLNIAYVPILNKIFPEAKYILALRHPCDACLSCFMHSFGHNAAMANLTSIEDSVSLYADVMSTWERCTSTSKISYHTLRYEDLLDNFQYQVMQLLEFLGLEWDDAVLSHVEKARSRGVIDTPSYDQVTEPLYKRAVDRWIRYKSLFGPHMHKLDSFICAYGYGK